jgi:hypothetical protein
VPKSRLRKNRSHASQAIEQAPLDIIKESPRWLAPLMVAAFLAGLIWIVIFYVSGTRYPIPNIGSWNMLVGFVFVGFGFTLATRWK